MYDEVNLDDVESNQSIENEEVPTHKSKGIFHVKI